jgi:hypothetical protein
LSRNMKKPPSGSGTSKAKRYYLQDLTPSQASEEAIRLPQTYSFRNRLNMPVNT